MIGLSIIAGIALFTNTMVMQVSNISSGSLVTNQDSIFTNSSLFYLSLSEAVHDYDGQPVTLVSNSGPFILINQIDGRGYATNLTVPDRTTNIFAYTAGSLAYHMVTNTQGRTNGRTASISEPIYSGSAPTSFNAAGWFHDAPEITAIAYRRNGAEQFCPSAVSPRHVLSNAHVSLAINDILIFNDDNNVKYTNSVLAVTNITAYDACVAILASNLPASIHPFMILPGNFNIWMLSATNVSYSQGIGCNQQHKLFSRIVSSWTNAEFPLLDSIYTTRSTSQWIDASWEIAVISGDSGYAMMVPIRTNLVLLGSWISPTTIYNVSRHQTQINSAMHYLSTNNAAATDYQLTTIDLSGFPSY